MRLLQIVWKDLRQGHNLDIYITTTIAIGIAILGIFGVADQPVISAAILATLSVVLLALLQNRHEYDSITRTLTELVRPEPSANLFFEKEFDREGLKKPILQSQKVYFWSVTFSTTLRTMIHTIEEALLSGTEVRILLVKPDNLSPARSKLLDQSRKESTGQGIRDVLRMLSEISTTTQTTKLEVRLVDHLPSCAMIVINPHLQTGLMRIRLNTLHIPGKTRPAFTLYRDKDKDWFEFFYSQYEIVWKEAEIVDLQTCKG
jgi:hypothetical protein